MNGAPAVADLVLSRFGIIRSLTENQRERHGAKLHVVNASSGPIERLVTGGPRVVGSGASIAHDAAVQSAIGEVLERYSARYVPPGSRLISTFEELGSEAAHPAGFALFHPTQYGQPDFPFVEFTEKTRLAWVRGIELGTGKCAWVPSQLVYLHHDLGTAEARISYTTSSGLACATSFEEASLKALLEVIERDAAMLAWYGRYSPRRIDISADLQLTEIERSCFSVPRVHHVALDLSVFHDIPTVLAMVQDDNATGVTAFGGACSIEPRTAWLKAVTEAYHTRMWAIELQRSEARTLAFPEDVKSLEDHVRYYSVREHASALDFLKQSTSVVALHRLPRIEAGSPSQAIARIAHMLQSSAISSYAVNVTSPDVADAGFRVARVLCPEMCRLDVSYRTRHLGGERLYSASAHRGIRPDRLGLADLNPDPHPFP
jgi:ribosomal protein S12 methylthiotransferase accessory factor